jgi:hypothetical protein
VEATSDELEVVHTIGALSGVTSWVLVTQTNEGHGAQLIKVSELLRGKGVVVEPGGVWSTVEQTLDLIGFQHMIVVDIVNAARGRELNSRKVGERISDGSVLGSWRGGIVWSVHQSSLGHRSNWQSVHVRRGRVVVHTRLQDGTSKIPNIRTVCLENLHDKKFAQD